MKKFLLTNLLIFVALLGFSQFPESFDAGTTPAGWLLSQGMKVSDYQSPANSYNNPTNACADNIGLLTPGVGGNNPARVLMPALPYTDSKPTINMVFHAFVFASSLKCSSDQDFPCPTYVQAYIVSGSYNSTAIPSAADIYATGPTQLLYAHGSPPNVLSFTSGDFTTPIPNGQSFRILLNFSSTANCNQSGVKYILDDFSVSTTAFPLPVSLVDFDAVQKSGKVSLSWETAQEVDVDGFEIQRKSSNGGYQTIAFVDSKSFGGSSSSLQNYSFDDLDKLPSGPAYYRLKVVDLNGKYGFSNIRAIRNNSKSLIITVYPNPSQGFTNVVIPDDAGTMDMTLDDFTGKMIQKWTNLKVQNIQITNLKPGIYMLRVSIRETGETISQKLLVK